MGETCTKVNVVIAGSVTTYLDKYVVLAFFLSLVISITTVLLLVKCVTYYIQEDRKRVKQNLALPRTPAPVDDLEDSDSEFNELWSDDEEDNGAESVGIVETGATQLDQMSVASEEVPQNLDTNYVTPVQSETNFRKHATLSHPLLSKLKEKSDKIVFIPNECLTRSLFPHWFEAQRIDLFSVFYDKLIEAVWFRKSCILQLLNFILAVFSEMHVLSRENRMTLQGKYEQEIEDYSVTDSSVDLSFGTALQNIVKTMTRDLLETGSELEEKTIERVTHSLYLPHFDCLKCLTAEFAGIESLIETHESSKLTTIVEAQCYQLQIKNRIFSIIRFMDTGKADKAALSVITADYKQKVADVLHELGGKFNTTLQTLIRVNRKYRKDELDKLLTKHEREFGVLRQEMVKTFKLKGVEESVGKFHEYIILLFKEYIQEKNETVVRLNRQEEEQLKDHYTKQYKNVVGKLNEIETGLFSSLLEAYRSNDRVVNITTNIETHLKGVKEKCTLLKKHLVGKYANVTQNWTKFTQVIIDYVIKAVSTEFRCMKSTFNASLRQMPMFTEDIITGIMNSVQRKFSIIVFDLVAVIIEDVVKTTQKAMYDTNTTPPNPRQLMCNIVDLAEELRNYNGEDYVVSVEMLDWLLPDEVDLNDFNLEDFLNNYKEVIYTVSLKLFS